MTKGRPYRKDENKKCDPKHRSKSTLDDTRRKNEENPDLLRALTYLKGHGYEESEDDEPRPSLSTGHQSRPHNRQRVEQYECGKAEDTDGKAGICFNFEKKCACLIRGCKYIHMDRNASYPNYSNDLKRKRSNTEENGHKLYRSDINDNRNRFKPERICYNFVNTGQCRFGHDANTDTSIVPLL